jgi:hypothetical protein
VSQDILEERVAELESFRQRIERAWPAEAAVAFLKNELDKAVAEKFRFARELMEVKSKLAAIHFVTTPNAGIPGIPLSTDGEENVSTGKAMPEFQQTDPL